MKEKYTYTPERKVYGGRIYIGNKNGEEFFIRPVKWDCDWYWGGVYLEGLRPETEDTLRERQRDSDPEDYGIELEGAAGNYFDVERWRNDIEEEWNNHHDTQIEQEREGETYYLGFGCHTHCDSVLLNECEGNYKKALEVFDKLFLSEEEFNKLIDILKRFYGCKEYTNKTNKKYLREMKKAEDVLKELEDFLRVFAELPTKEFWINPEQ